MNATMHLVPLPRHAPDPGPVPLLQSAAAALTLAADRIAVVSEDGRRVAQALILRRLGLSATLQGPLWHPGSTAQDRIAALRALRRHGLRLIEAGFDSDAPLLRAAGFRRVATPAHVAELALHPDAAQRRRTLDGKWRNRLVAAEAAGLLLRHRPLAGTLDPLFAAEAVQRRAGRYHALPLGFAAAFPGASVVEALRDGTPLAAMLFLRHGTAATYHIGHTTAAGRAAEAHRLILWHMAGRLAAEGCTRLDLGTIDTETAPGLARFKLGIGATARGLGGSFLAIPGL
jgi:hypothetical protein